MPPSPSSFDRISRATNVLTTVPRAAVRPALPFRTPCKPSASRPLEQAARARQCHMAPLAPPKSSLRRWRCTYSQGRRRTSEWKGAGRFGPLDFFMGISFNNEGSSAPLNCSCKGKTTIDIVCTDSTKLNEPSICSSPTALLLYDKAVHYSRLFLITFHQPRSRSSAIRASLPDVAETQTRLR